MKSKKLLIDFNRGFRYFAKLLHNIVYGAKRQGYTTTGSNPNTPMFDRSEMAMKLGMYLLDSAEAVRIAKDVQKDIQRYNPESEVLDSYIEVWSRQKQMIAERDKIIEEMDKIIAELRGNSVS